MAVAFSIQKMSEHMEAVQILKWLVKEGDQVEKFQVILEVMTDKVTAEIESPAAGVVKGIRQGAADGATVPTDEPICYIAAADETVPALSPLVGTLAAEPSVPEPVVSLDEWGSRASRASARRTPATAASVTTEAADSGHPDRLLEADETATAADQPAVAAPPDELLALTPIQRVAGSRLRASVLNAPQFVLEADVDMSAALGLLDEVADRVVARTGEKPTLTALLVRVAAVILREQPHANAEFVDGKLKVHREVNVGVATATRDGVIVPVIKHADGKSLSEITVELAAFQEKARTLRFIVADLAGGTFTVSNLGMFGVDRFRAIVNPPQSAILAAGRVIKTPVGLPDDTIALRPIMTLTLTVDHRCMDGVQAAQFLCELKALIEQPHLLLT